jgi:outer membrane protein OmpA-like peptidoglycan-associated protein
MKRIVTLCTVGVLIFAGSGCSRTMKGAGIGTAAGAGAGALIGKATGNTARGAIIGAAVGGTAGALIGRQMDKQAEEMEADLQGVKVERVGEGIKLTFDSGILFDVNKAELQPAAQMNLEKLATIFNKYPDTNVLIEGHTDSTGSQQWNMQLSKMRAESVGAKLTTMGVDPARFTMVGYGPDQPVASNDTAEGRQMNRRVELAVMANDKMKGWAEDQTAG